jgi:hypothetical protein
MQKCRIRWLELIVLLRRGEFMSISNDVEKFFNDTELLRAELGKWIESEEERLQRDLSDEEINKRRDELFEKYSIKRI